MDDFCYKCRCGYIFEEKYGKCGCPFCCGNPPARLVKMTPAKEKILRERQENELIWNPETKKGAYLANGWECETDEYKIWD